MRRIVATVLLVLQASPAFALDLDSLFYRPLDPDAWAESGPRLLLGRFIDAYSRRDLDAYAALLANDFVFHFGDEEERALHPDGWGRDDEIASAEHLFHGTAARPAATSITLDPGEILVLPDPEHPCDRARYALIDLPRVTLVIELANGEQLRVAGHHAYWIVKEGENWKVRRWDEERENGSREHGLHGNLPGAPTQGVRTPNNGSTFRPRGSRVERVSGALGTQLVTTGSRK